MPVPATQAAPTSKPSSTRPSQSSSRPLQVSAAAAPAWALQITAMPLGPQTSVPACAQAPSPALQGAPRVGKPLSISPSQSLSRPSQVSAGAGSRSAMQVVGPTGPSRQRVRPVEHSPGTPVSQRWPSTQGEPQSVSSRSLCPSQSSSRPLSQTSVTHMSRGVQMWLPSQTWPSGQLSGAWRQPGKQAPSAAQKVGSGQSVSRRQAPGAASGGRSAASTAGPASGGVTVASRRGPASSVGRVLPSPPASAPASVVVSPPPRSSSGVPEPPPSLPPVPQAASSKARVR